MPKRTRAAPVINRTSTSCSCFSSSPPKLEAMPRHPSLVQKVQHCRSISSNPRRLRKFADAKEKPQIVHNTCFANNQANSFGCYSKGESTRKSMHSPMHKRGEQVRGNRMWEKLSKHFCHALHWSLRVSFSAVSVCNGDHTPRPLCYSLMTASGLFCAKRTPPSVARTVLRVVDFPPLGLNEQRSSWC